MTEITPIVAGFYGTLILHEKCANLLVPPYEHQKTDFTCGPASALMTLGEIEGDPHTDFRQ